MYKFKIQEKIIKTLHCFQVKKKIIKKDNGEGDAF